MPIRYDVPDGEFGGKYGDLVDDTYDGLRHKNLYLTKGLGQLTDGIVGQEDYRVNSGYEWIGWKATLNNSIDIQFEFENLVNFSSVTLHCHNLFHANIEYFQQLIAHFSLDGNQWSKNPIVIHMVPDHVNDNARDITIDLKNRVGRYVKLVLKFAAKWLLISEITFHTEPVSHSYQAKIEDLELVDGLRINKKSSSAHNAPGAGHHQHNGANGKSVESIKNIFAQEKEESLVKRLNFNGAEAPKKENNNLEFNSQMNGQYNQFSNNQFKAKFDTSMISPNETITLNAILISSVIFVCFCIFLLVSVIFYRKFNKKNDLLANNILKTTLVQNNNKLELMHKLQNVEFGFGDLNKQSLLNLRQPSSLSSHTGTLRKDNLNLPMNSPVTGSSSLINHSNPNNSSNGSSLVRSESNHEYAVPNLSHYEEINQSNYSGFYNKISELELNQKSSYNQEQLKLQTNKLFPNKLTSAFLSNQSNGSLSNLTNSLKRSQPMNGFKSYGSSKATTMKIGKNNMQIIANNLNSIANGMNENIKTQYKTSRPAKSSQASSIRSLLANDLKLSSVQAKQVKLLHPFIGQSKFGNISLAKIRLDHDAKSELNGKASAKQLALIETVDFQDMSYECSLEYKQQILNWLNLVQQLKNKSFYGEDAKHCLSNNFASILGILRADYSPYNQIQLVLEYGNSSLAAFLKQHSPETIKYLISFLLFYSNRTI